MYARDVDNDRLTFVVSGLLWNDGLIMLDQQTKSQWSQLLGKAMQGRLQGRQLRRIPSVVTTWKDWRQQYPDSSVVLLKRTANDFDRDYYQAMSDYVVGIVDQPRQHAWPFDLLRHDSPINDSVDETPVLVLWDEAARTARVFRRTVKGQTLEFHDRDGQLRDQQTGSRWDKFGTAQAGPLKSQRLQLMPSTISFRSAWTQFFPQTVFYKGELSAETAGR